MDKALFEALRRLVSSCRSAEELEVRVLQSFGEDMLGPARNIAANMRGTQWSEHHAGDDLARGEDPTWGFRSLAHFRGSNLDISPEQAEAIWDYFRSPSLPRISNKPPTKGHAYLIHMLIALPAGKAVIVTGLLLILAVLFPPFYGLLPQGLSFNAGYHFLLAPPSNGVLTARVDVALLSIELLVIVVCGGGCAYLASKLR